MSLFRLVYASRNRIASGPALRVAIDDILARSRERNHVAGLTGALMCNEGCFAQVLEGEREMVEATFERSQQDDRHDRASLLAFNPAEQRVFGCWSMGFVGRPSSHGEGFAGVAVDTGFDLSAMTGEHVLSLMQYLAEEQDFRQATAA